MDPVVDVTLRAALALLLLVAAGHKLRDLGRFRSTLAEYRLVPAALTPAAAGLVVAAEVTIAVALVAPTTRTTGPVAAAALLVVYGAAIAVNLARGRRHIDCGCTGPAADRPISGWLIARNLALATAALTAAVPLHPRPLVWVDAVTVVAATAVLAALYAAFDRMLADGPALARVRGVA